MKPPFHGRSAAMLGAVMATALSGCGAHARSPEQYRDATAQVLAAKSDELRACYDSAKRGDPTAEGTVSVHFKVAATTGKFVHPRVVGGTAPDTVKRCVLQSIEGTALAPADARDGDATFDWTFAPARPSA